MLMKAQCTVNGVAEEAGADPRCQQPPSAEEPLRTSGEPTARALHATSRVRHRTFRALRLFGSIIGIPHAAYASVLLARAGALRGLGAALVVAEVVVVAIGWLFTERTHRVGVAACIVMASILGCMSLCVAGMAVGTGLLFAWVCVACRVFYGPRAGLAAYLWIALQLVVYGVWRDLGGGAAGSWPGAVLVPTPIFVRYSLALLALVGILLATVAAVVSGLEESTRELGDALARERAEHEARREGETERARLESTLRQARKMETIGKLAGGIAHDFNNSLSVILSCAEELAEVVPEDHRADVEAIAAAVHSSNALTRHLLSYARHEPAAARPVEVRAVLLSLMEMLQRTLPKDISIVADRLGNSGDVVVLGNRSDLEHSLLNLALNARDAMPEGGTLTLSCRARALPAAEAAERPGVSPGPFVEIDIEDTGTGIPPEVLPRIFEPLFTTKVAGKGTGLGLSSVHGMVRDHRGAIEVYTELGKGTRFALLLPAAGEIFRVETVTRGRPGIAIVADDNPVQLAAARRCAIELFESVLEAADAREALEHLERRDGQVAALIAEYDMPGMTGGELAVAVRERWPAVAVVVTSGLHRDLGGLRLLYRPFSVADLEAAL